MLTYGIDWDDVISDLNTHAIQLANGEHGLDLKLKISIHGKMLARHRLSSSIIRTNAFIECRL